MDVQILDCYKNIEKADGKQPVCATKSINSCNNQKNKHNEKTTIRRSSNI